MTDILIRPAEKQDAGKVLEYTRIVGGQTDNLTFGSEGLSYTIEEEEKILDNNAKNDNSIFLLAFDNDDIIGIGNISSKTSKRTAHTATLGISLRREYWGEGVGRAIMAKFIEFSKDSGLEIIDLTVRSDNHRAISLYEKFNFKLAGTIPASMKIDGNYFDTHIMVLDLR